MSLAPFKLESLFLQDVVHRCPRIEALLPEGALSLLEGRQQRTLAPKGVIVDVKEFLDPTLRYNKKKYPRLMSYLRRRGLARPMGSCRERAGIFAVRRANPEARILKKTNPPGLRLVQTNLD